MCITDNTWLVDLQSANGPLRLLKLLIIILKAKIILEVAESSFKDKLLI